MNSLSKIDHLVYAVHDLDQAIDWFEAKLGVRPVFGGYHKANGTKNALLNLGRQCYLEILAIDKENTAANTPRWMGIDLLSKPKITRWALKTSSLEFDCEILKQYKPTLGHIQNGQRETAQGALLNWQMSMPLAEPEIEIAPFLVNWEESTAHPTDDLAKRCQLIGTILCHPNPKELQKTLLALSTKMVVAYNESVKIKAIIQCPNGVVEI